MAQPKKNNAPKRKKKEEPKKSAAATIKQELHDNVDNQQWSVVLFAIAILILLLAFIQGSSGWLAIHKALKGFFGLTVLVIPVMLGYIALMLDKDVTPQKIMRRAMTGLVSVAFFSGFIEIMFGGGRLQDQNLMPAVRLLYEEGLAWNGGGVLSALIAMPLLTAFGDVGSKIIICLLLFVSLMWLTKKGLMDFLAMLASPFRSIWRMIHEEYEDSEIIREYEEQAEERPTLLQRLFPEVKSDPKPEEEPVPEEEPAQKPARKPKLAKKKEPEFLLDIPLEGAQPPLPQGNDMELDIPLNDEPVKKQVSLEKKTAASPEQDAALDELIRQATEKPKKKNKQEQQQEAISEIADEVAAQAGSHPEKAVPYRMPSIDFLKAGESHANDPNAASELRDKADRLKEVLQSFNVSVRITNIARGPAVTRYEIQPAAGVKVAKITSLSDDIALSFAAEGVRIEAPIPGKAAVGIEVPNTKRDTVSLREILESKQFQESKSKLSFAVGRDIAGNTIIGDIAKMPHMIIAGTTGSGKSICTNSIIMSILYHATPAEVKLILIDPKIVEFRIYDGIPHLLIPVVTDPKKAAGALNWAVQEMLQRYSTFAETGVRDLEDYNRLCKEREDLTPMPQIVIAIDELADLMMAASKEVEDSICRLAQMARAAGMHLIIATQRPTTDIITGLIKANIPSRIALKVQDAINSRIILDAAGADKLLGKGDMLYLPNGQPKPVRVQGCFVSTQEIEKTVKFIKESAQSEYDETIMQAVEQIAASNTQTSAGSDDESAADGDADLIEKAIEVVVNAGQASTSNLQRRLKLGYARAARIMDELEEMGIIGPYEGAKPRRVLLTKMQYEERKLRKMNSDT